MIGNAFEDILKGIIQADDGQCTENLLQLVAETVYCSGVLGRLLEVQKLDVFDIEGVIHLYYNIISEPCLVCRDLDEAGRPHRYSSLHSVPFDKSLKIVKDFLIAATAKDCSLMISFRPRDDRDLESSCSSVYLHSTKQIFDYKANFIDLDLKPLKKIVKYYELDKEILNCYSQVLDTVDEAGNDFGVEVYESANGEIHQD
ncbi:hypothetical protein Tsubulata_033792 [Turnera subulata]|uniref:Inositol-pentakisphosphate 2-kinase n=1 Tax=Turnera subulata TaxID=218843 RepID=A0A9Q0F3Y6_9ROSI|nr:hypothetical protein Tsubulata_033792 [Turnera subulata]